MMLETVLRRAHEFDVLHFHLDYLPFSLFSRQPVPHVTTLHGRLDLPEIWPHLPHPSRTCRWSRSRTASASRCLRRTGRRPSITACRQTCCGRSRAQPDYLAFLGRISPEKGVDRAIEIAGRAGMTLKIAAKVDSADQDYFDAKIRPLLRAAACRVHRRDQRRQKPRLPRRRARAAVPDRLAGAVRPGDDRGDGLRHAGDRLRPRLGAGGDRGRADRLHRRRLDEAVARGGPAAAAVDRAAVRRRFEQRFTARRMAEDYVALYERLVRAKLPPMRAIAAE